MWKIQEFLTDGDGYSADLEKNIHRAIKKVGDDYDRMKFNTAIATLMSLVNDFYKKGSVTKGEYITLITLLNPVAPHMTEELWEMLGGKGYLSLAPWPKYDESKTVDDEIEIVVQVNGKVRGKVTVAADSSEDVMKEKALACEDAKPFTDGKNIVKVIVVKGRLVNIVVK